MKKYMTGRTIAIGAIAVLLLGATFLISSGQTEGTASTSDVIDSIKRVFKSGTVSGKVTVSPLCPAEPCPKPASDLYSSHQVLLYQLDVVVLSPSPDGKSMPIPIYLKIDSKGRFKGRVPAGTYLLNITDCKWLGCKDSLPKTVTVKSNKTTRVNIDIDTGIR